jgi:hypothetical protein
MNSKTDKEDRTGDDIAFLSEIIADFRFGKQSIIEVPRNSDQIIPYNKMLNEALISINLKSYLLVDASNPIRPFQKKLT